MFAFAYFDLRTDTLWLLRDRLGIKPMSVIDLPDQLPFASEDKAPDWVMYMRSTANVAANGSGIVKATPGSKPLIFEETIGDKTRTIAIQCRGDGEERFCLFLTFNVV